MSEQRPRRIMWLLNHTTARDFELSMLKRLGFREFFLPKITPHDPAFRSASVDFSEDANLTIPPADLDILNGADWYGEPSAEAWAIANRHFDLLFFILYNPDFLPRLARNFQGAAVLRAYGVGKGDSYSVKLPWAPQGKGEESLRRMGRRFWFGAAYENLPAVEGKLLCDRAIYLPLGMQDNALRDSWVGDVEKIYFLCPDIGINAHYKATYEQFKTDFSGFDYAVGGSQLVKVDDPAVLGFLPRADHESNLSRYRVMFYRSAGPQHVHYHPFEAVRAGMPLVFMASSQLDALGGIGLPGRCETIAEARKKIRRILAGDRRLIAAIRTTQVRLLERMKPESCAGAWAAGIPQILETLDRVRNADRPVRPPKKRIAIMIPIPYGGGTLRSTKALARALLIGSRAAGEEAEIVLAYLTDSGIYPDSEFADLPDEIKRRPFGWQFLSTEQAAMTAAYAFKNFALSDQGPYLLPDDGINNFLDCDLWVVVSDRLSAPLIPLRPYIMIVHDYVQRYEPVLVVATDFPFLTVAQKAERVLVTSAFTEADARQYAGLQKDKVCRLPLILPDIPEERQSQRQSASLLPPFFIWPTNVGRHKNHENAAEALRRYYEDLDGQLDCRVTGITREEVLAMEIPHLKTFVTYRKLPALRRHVHLMGNMRSQPYADLMARARFIWHTVQVDNGTFSVIEGAMEGVPALSSDYPAIREMDAQFALGLNWMDSHDPADMARQLKFMEGRTARAPTGKPKLERFHGHSVEQLAATYWKAVRECL